MLVFRYDTSSRIRISDFFIRRIFLSQRKFYDHSFNFCSFVEEKKRGRKKKRVQFAENVKDTAGNGEEYRKEYNKKFAKQFDRTCRNDQIQGMPANRVALYNGILRDRVHRMEYSY